MARNKELDPVLAKDRDMSYSKFTFSWASDMIAIFSFATGAGAIAAGLSIFQALLAVTIALAIDAILMTLNGMPGFKLGIPMIVQMRPCFGDKASTYVSMLRAVPAIMWAGYNSFLGALGLNLFSIMLFGYNNVWVWFFIFHFAQVFLSMMGVKKVLNFTAYAAIALFVVILVMACYIFYLYGVDEIVAAASTKGTNSALAFIGVITANVSMNITVGVNASDYVRDIRNDSVAKYTISWFAGEIIPVLVLSALGMVVYRMSGIWSPIDLFVKYVPSFLIVIIAMIFIILGQFSTNMFANVMPSNIIFQNVFRFPWWFAAIFTGSLSLFVLPWFLTTSNGFYSFMNVYGALLGPLCGIMIADFWVIRKQKYNIRALYIEGDQYSYKNGVNIAGLLALAISFILSVLYLDLSTIIGLVSSFVLYLIFYKYMIAPKYPQAELAPDYVPEDPSVVSTLDD